MSLYRTFTGFGIRLKGSIIITVNVDLDGGYTVIIAVYDLIF